MEAIRIDNKEIIIMNLVHYFVTEKNYNPVVVHGINDEIWLENMDSDYKIVRIVSRYIHNDEQLGFNRFRSRQITKKLRLKTLSFKMNVLSIFVDIGDNVKSLSEDTPGNASFVVNDLKDVKNNSALLQVFPDIVEKTNHDEKGIDLLFKITDDINQTNEKKNAKMEKIFSVKKPFITYILMALCVLTYIINLCTNNLLMALGANIGIFVKAGQLWRLVTCMFLHVDIVHLLCNMYALYIVGPRVEDFFGKKKFLLIYFISGISASLLSVGLNGNVSSVGASGAIFGLFGALLYFGYTYRGYVGTMVKSEILPVIVVNLLISFMLPGIDVWGHVGGLIGGIIASYMLGTIDNKKYEISNISVFIIYFVFLIYLALFR